MFKKTLSLLKRSLNLQELESIVFGSNHNKIHPSEMRVNKNKTKSLYSKSLTKFDPKNNINEKFMDISQSQDEEILTEEKTHVIEQDVHEQTFENVTAITENKNINLKRSPTYPIHPKQIPEMKLEKIYSYDTIQLVETLKYIDFKQSNLNKLVNMLSVLRKKKELKIYDFPEILNSISFIRNNLDSLSPSYLVSFFYTLSSLQNFNEDKQSLDSQTIFYESLNIITKKLNKIDIRGLSNVAYALQTVQLKNPTVYNFDEFFDKMEVNIIEKIEKNRHNLKPLDVTNIILAYCKTQNGSEEFYRIFQEIAFSFRNALKTQDIAIIIYSYGNNDRCNEKILTLFEDTISHNLKFFKPKELCSILRAFHKRNLLNDVNKKMFSDFLVDKHEYFNATDLAHFYAILAEENNNSFLKYINKCLTNLCFTFTGSDMQVIMQKAEYIQKHNIELYNLLQKHVLRLIERKEQ